MRDPWCEGNKNWDYKDNIFGYIYLFVKPINLQSPFCLCSVFYMGWVNLPSHNPPLPHHHLILKGWFLHQPLDLVASYILWPKRCKAAFMTGIICTAWISLTEMLDLSFSCFWVLLGLIVRWPECYMYCWLKDTVVSHHQPTGLKHMTEIILYCTGQQT